MTKATHYSRSKVKTLCGLFIQRKNAKGKMVRLETDKEIGCVSCQTCKRIWMAAGMKTLGF